MKKITLTLFALTTCLFAFSQKAQDLIGVGKTIKFNGTKFELKWSQHPADYYYIQEWLPHGETFENYNQMFTVSVHFSDELTPEIAVKNKLQELDERAKTDACCKYNVFENDGEYIIDFLVSEGDGKTLSIVERDVHYYKQVEINGKKALQLLFYSRRAYGDDIMPYLSGLKDTRTECIFEIAEMKLKVKIKK